MSQQASRATDSASSDQAHSSESKPVDLKIEFPGRDEIHLQGELTGGYLKNWKVQAVGCEAFLTQLAWLGHELKNHPLDEIELPSEDDHSSMLLRELLLKLQERWNFPYEQEELCHCRVVSTQRVDASVLNGARTAEEVAGQTSAGTGCGTCRPDCEKIIHFRRFFR